MPENPSTPPRFTLTDAEAFISRSTSPETQRTYRKVINGFLHHFGYKHPKEITSKDMIAWRDGLMARKQKPATVRLKLVVVRALYDYLIHAGIASSNPASSYAISLPDVPDESAGRALNLDEVERLLNSPARGCATGARDYAIMLLMLRTSIRVAEAVGLRMNDRVVIGGKPALRVKVKGRSERLIPYPEEVREAIDAYLKLDRSRRKIQHTDKPDSPIFQPSCNYRTLAFNKSISTSWVGRMVGKWARFAGIGKVSPHDLRRTAITRALDQGLSLRAVQAMSGHRDPKTVMGYDKRRSALEVSAVNELSYEKEKKQ